MRQRVCVSCAAAALVGALSLASPAKGAEVPGWYAWLILVAEALSGNPLAEEIWK